ALELAVQDVDVISDSELLVKQMTGEYRVKNEALRKLSLEAARVARAIGDVSYTAVRREHNELADRLVNEALDAKANPEPRLDHVRIPGSDWGRSNGVYPGVPRAGAGERGDGYAYRFGDQQLNVHGPGLEPSIVARDPVRPGNSDLCFVWSGTADQAVEHLRSRGVEIELGPVERPGARGVGMSVYFR